MSAPAIMQRLTQGTRVRFTGETQGRDDTSEVHEGIVNGEPRWYPREGFGFVPVHMPRYDHNLAVEFSHIVEVLP